VELLLPFRLPMKNKSESLSKSTSFEYQWWDSGWLFKAYGDDLGLTSFDFSKKKKKVACQLMRQSQLPAYIVTLRKKIHRYLKGEKVSFLDTPLNLSKSPPFSRKVLLETKKIQWGKVVTYRELAKRAKSEGAARAVGNSMNKNPFLIIIPCHRVLRTDGSLGGFAKGLNIKKELLSLERIEK